MLFEQKRFNNNGFLILIISQIILWITYFFRPLVGADPYFYLNSVCSGNIVSPDIGFGLLLQFLPCNVFVFQLILLIVWLLLLFVVLKIGELFSKRDGWWLPVIVATMTFFVFEFWKFENNVFGYLFAFIGFYFVFKSFLDKKYFCFDLKNVLIIGTMFFLAGIFWKGSVYWLLVLPLFNFLFIPLIGFMSLPNFFGFFTVASTTGMIFEHTMFIGLVYLFITPLFFIGFIKTNRKIVIACLLLLMPCVFVLKMYVLPILFISIICFNCFKMFENKININLTLKTWTILMTIFFIINLGTQFPTQQDINLIQNIVDQNQTIENTFGTGYIIRWLGGQEKYYASYSNDPLSQGFVIDIPEKEHDCLLIEESRHLRSWKCD